jgi:cytochrome c oxidase subunit II
VVTRTIVEVRRGPPEDSDPLHVTVIGHQWWWEYRYPDHGVTTANELHVEAGRPVVVDLESMDVVHSFWVPRLAGKTDVVPGRTNRMWFMANEPGIYQGQCAEYCGMQHANMLLIVQAQPREQFVAWLEQQRQPGQRDAKAQAGRDLFLANACANCHAIAGTVAQGTFGPDLTHLMSRQTLASGMVPNNRDQLTQWVLDPQTIKPGCLMPGMHMGQREVDGIVSYLQTLE